MGKFKEKQRVCITSGKFIGQYAEIIMSFGQSYCLRLDGSGELIEEHNLQHVKGSKEAEDAERKAEEEAHAREARAAEKRLEEEAQAKALAAIRRAEERERGLALAAEAERRAAEAARQAAAPDGRREAGAARPEGEAAARRGPQAARGAEATAEEEQLFERGDSSAPETYPVQAGDARRGSHLMIKGHPCRCIEVSASKAGKKHGHAKAHIVAVDVFTGKKYEDVFAASHYIDVPYVKRMEYQVVNVDLETGEVSLLHESGVTRDDLNLPTFVKAGEQTDDDRRLQRDLVEAFDMGQTVMVAVVSALGEEKIVDMKTL